MDSRLQKMDSPLQDLDTPTYETKPICEQLLKEIIETRRELCKRLEQTEALFRETRADLRDVEDRIDKIEGKLLQ